MGVLTLPQSTKAFAAMHVLPVLLSWHPCSRLHGHHLTVTLDVADTRLNDEDSGNARLIFADVEQ